MLSDKLRNRITLLCYATVSHNFALLLNDKYRGPNFKWENFPKLAKVQCRGQVYMANIGSDKNKNDCFEFAEEIGEEIASNLIDWAGLINNE